MLFSNVVTVSCCAASYVLSSAEHLLEKNSDADTLCV